MLEAPVYVRPLSSVLTLLERNRPTCEAFSGPRCCFPMIGEVRRARATTSMALLKPSTPEASQPPVAAPGTPHQSRTCWREREAVEVLRGCERTVGAARGAAGFSWSLCSRAPTRWACSLRQFQKIAKWLGPGRLCVAVSSPTSDLIEGAAQYVTRQQWHPSRHRSCSRRMHRPWAV
jgi:hypothetical protein